jgi:hypothetical protein
MGRRASSTSGADSLNRPINIEGAHGVGRRGVDLRVFGMASIPGSPCNQFKYDGPASAFRPAHRHRVAGMLDLDLRGRWRIPSEREGRSEYSAINQAGRVVRPLAVVHQAPPVAGGRRQRRQKRHNVNVIG